MTKLVLQDVASGFNLQVINDNFQKIEDELQNKVLYRNNPVGEPNTLEADIDANSKRILNLPAPLLDGEPARLAEIHGITAEGQAIADAASVFADASAASAAASLASQGVATTQATNAGVSATNAAISATAASNSAALAQSYTTLGFNASNTTYDFGLVTDVAVYFPIDLGGIP